MEYKRYTEEEFDKWCEENNVEDDFGFYEFIKNQDVILGFDENSEEEIANLCIKVKLLNK